MLTNNLLFADSYLRLSKEEAQRGESTSISNQRMIIENYCKQNGIIIVKEYVDDGYSGANFERPGFQELIEHLNSSDINLVITKDLSRLGRDMRESSYYAEEYFPENRIRYIAIGDSFDTEVTNVMAPFHFAMNEVYLRECSKKIKDVFKVKREKGLYCHCSPYGYKKDANDKNHLVPDENTAPIVQRIFEQASKGDSSKKITADLNNDNIIPPLKYRVLYTGEFSEKGAQRATDFWHYTTVKRILKNEVYLGHTVLGKSKKVSVSSKKKVPIPKEDWAITRNTHEPLITQELFDVAQVNMGKNTKKYEGYGRVRKRIFSGIAYCDKCGYAMCSSGSVYKNEREKYWYLSCTHKKNGTVEPCSGVRIRYSDLINIVINDLNKYIAMSDDEIKELTENAISQIVGENSEETIKLKKEKATNKLSVINKAMVKLYMDNASGDITDSMFKETLNELQKETAKLKHIIETCNDNNVATRIKKNYEKFFCLIKNSTHIEELTREILLSYIDRIEIGEKIYEGNVIRDTHNNKPFHQDVRIFYKFINDRVV